MEIEKNEGSFIINLVGFEFDFFLYGQHLALPLMGQQGEGVL